MMLMNISSILIGLDVIFSQIFDYKVSVQLTSQSSRSFREFSIPWFIF